MLRSALPLGLATLLLAGCGDADLEDLLGLEMYFVKLSGEPSEVVGSAQEIADLFGLEIIHTYDKATEGFSVKLPEVLVPELRDLEEVEYIRKDKKEHRVPDEEKPKQDPVQDPAPLLGDDEIPESLLRIGAPYLGTGLNAIHVAVIDTGIDGAHPDLNVVGSVDIVAQSGSGRAAPNGDPNGHGTHCAGTIGAVADGEGVVGVAPGVPLHAIRVLNEDGYGYWTDIVAGLEYVLEHPEIRVVNMSLGGPALPPGEPDPMRDAIERLEANGVVVVIAAGNEAQDTDNVSPAGYGLGIVVSAYDAAGGTDNGFAWFSNYGDQVDIAAPGVDILSTWPGGSYTQLSGTSMATPAVAGAVAAYLATDSGAGVNRVRNQVVSTGEDGYQGQRGDHPEPLLDVAALVP